MPGLSSISKATARDLQTISEIGRIAVAESHEGSCSKEEMNDYLEENYHAHAIGRELADEKNSYYLIKHQQVPAGFSKIVCDTPHPNISLEHVAKLDRIYLLKEYHGLGLGLELMQFNIQLAQENAQQGIWLYTWIGNQRAVDFYLKLGFTIVGSHRFYVTPAHYNLSHHMFLSLADVQHK